MVTNKTTSFDIEAAKNGAKVVTRDGKPVDILCYDARTENGSIVALIHKGNKDSVSIYYENGKIFKHSDDDRDLFILEKEILTFWTLIYKMTPKAPYEYYTCNSEAEVYDVQDRLMREGVYLIVDVIEQKIQVTC